MQNLEWNRGHLKRATLAAVLLVLLEAGYETISCGIVSFDVFLLANVIIIFSGLPFGALPAFLTFVLTPAQDFGWRSIAMFEAIALACFALCSYVLAHPPRRWGEFTDVILQNLIPAAIASIAVNIIAIQRTRSHDR